MPRMPKMHNFWCRYDSLLLYEGWSTIYLWTSAFNRVEKDGTKKKANRVEEQSESYYVQVKPRLKAYKSLREGLHTKHM